MGKYIKGTLYKKTYNDNGEVISTNPLIPKTLGSCVYNGKGKTVDELFSRTDTLINSDVNMICDITLTVNTTYTTTDHCKFYATLTESSNLRISDAILRFNAKFVTTGCTSDDNVKNISVYITDESGIESSMSNLSLRDLTTNEKLTIADIKSDTIYTLVYKPGDTTNIYATVLEEPPVFDSMNLYTVYCTTHDVRGKVCFIKGC